MDGAADVGGIPERGSTQPSRGRGREGSVCREFQGVFLKQGGHRGCNINQIDSPDTGKLPRNSEGYWRRARGIMSPHLTSSLPKENCLILTLAHYLPAPCSCLVWLGRQTRGLREGFMKEEACDGRGSQRGQCERRPGGDLGKRRPVE